MDDDLGVGFGSKDVAAIAKPLAQIEVVLDDPVVNYHDFRSAVEVGMSVLFGRLAVRGPPGVADADRTGHWLGLHDSLERGKLSGASAERYPPIVNDGDSRRAVAPVFQTAKPVEHHLRSLLAAYLPH